MKVRRLVALVAEENRSEIHRPSTQSASTDADTNNGIGRIDARRNGRIAATSARVAIRADDQASAGRVAKITG
jgi:hypothetical protein